MDDWQRCVKTTKEWIGFLQPYIEDELGPLPNMKYYRPLFKGKSQRITMVPFMNAFSKGHEGWIVYDKGYESWFYRHLKSEKTKSNEFGLGRLVYALTHDLVHPYQFGPLMKKKGIINNYIYRCVKHFHWLEGLAQLYSFKICSRIYSEAETEDFNQLNRSSRGSIEDFITQSIKEKRYKNSLRREIARHLGRDTKLLRKKGYLSKEDFSFSSYPFELHPDLTRQVIKNISEGKKEFRRSWLRIGHYVLGAHNLNRLISGNIFSMQELVKNPLSYWEIKAALQR